MTVLSVAVLLFYFGASAQAWTPGRPFTSAIYDAKKNGDMFMDQFQKLIRQDYELFKQNKQEDSFFESDLPSSKRSLHSDTKQPFKKRQNFFRNTWNKIKPEVPTAREQLEASLSHLCKVSVVRVNKLDFLLMEIAPLNMIQKMIGLRPKPTFIPWPTTSTTPVMAITDAPKGTNKVQNDTAAESKTDAPEDPTTDSTVESKNGAIVEPTSNSKVDSSSDDPVELTTIGKDQITDVTIESITGATVVSSSGAEVEPTANVIMESTTGPIEDKTSDAPVELTNGATVEQTNESKTDPSSNEPVESTTIGKDQITDATIESITGATVESSSGAEVESTANVIIESTTGPVEDTASDAPVELTNGATVEQTSDSTTEPSSNEPVESTTIGKDSITDATVE